MINRRNFLLGVPLAAAATGVARASNAHPTTTPDAALHQLIVGNERYVRGKLDCDMQLERRAKLAAGQAPIAAILSCSDSRVPIDDVFDQSPGTIFSVRVAGNVATAETIGSVQYAVEELKTPLILVMGHENCGAVKAAMIYKKDGNKLPGEIQSIIDVITPALTSGGEEMRVAVDQNTKHAAAKLHASEMVGGTKIVTAYFDIASGRVTLLK